MRAGIHHVGLVTLKPQETIEFYTKKLGFNLVIHDMINPPAGGEIQHMFFDMGDGSFLAFLSPKDVPGIPAEFETGISAGLGLPGGYYHLAFWVDDVEALAAKRDWLLERGVDDVSNLVDHDFSMSIYFQDPNGLQLEYCATTRAFTEADRDLSAISQPGMLTDDPEEARKLAIRLMGAAMIPAKC